MAATRGKRGDRPWRKVVEAIFERGAGKSIFRSELPLGNEWTLKLECGHGLQYAVRYVSEKDSVLAGAAHHRFGRGWHRRRAAEDALPAPARVRCPFCDREKR